MDKKKPEIPMTACKSSCIKAHGYDAASKTLALTYNNGKTYHHPDVPASVYAGLGEAKSIGKYVASNIAGKYKATS